MSTPTATPPRINLPAPRPPQAPDAALTTGTRIVGSAFNALDLEKLRQWYETVLGFRVVQVYEQAGAVFEYLLTPAGGGGVLALITTGQRPPGPNGYGRLILQVPNARELADVLHAQGVTTRVAVPGLAYMVQDPEGNTIELYTPPAAKG